MKKPLIIFCLTFLVCGCYLSSQETYEQFKDVEQTLLDEYYKSDVIGAVENLHELTKCYEEGKHSKAKYRKWDKALSITKARLADLYQACDSKKLCDLYLSEAIGHWKKSTNKDISKEELLNMIQQLDSKNCPKWKK